MNEFKVFKEWAELCTVPIQFLIMAAAIAALIYNYWSTRRVMRREIYQRLELASIDLFRFEMQNSNKIWRLYDPNYDLATASGQEYQEITNHVTQILNLFEMCVELHARKIVDKDIYSTWVKWFHEIGQYRNFQHFWDKTKEHYTVKLQKIMDIAIDKSKINEFVRELINNELAPDTAELRKIMGEINMGNSSSINQIKWRWGILGLK